jgi:hypothetical protein
MSVSALQWSGFVYCKWYGYFTYAPEYIRIGSERAVSGGRQGRHVTFMIADNRG